MQDLDLDRAVAQYWRKRKILETQIYGANKKKAQKRAS
jgi:hypothetical protein